MLEKLANLEHDRWSKWQEYLHSKCTRNEDGSLTIPSWAVERWERQIRTKYAELTEQEKESDRVEARKTLVIVDAEIIRLNDRIAELEANQLKPGQVVAEWVDCYLDEALRGDGKYLVEVKPE